ncbi:CPBP family intramembrane metalloprotease [Canibacter sp. lx-45]|uniref:CPBP family intramembrane glutamic endopeptidase n=1 Tax=Canibacter zhuwentaonis TaxID=2837491 RepID=UPI001BDD8581|nr:CPBP family intramembrane glutamic endopeptidase [Canibacter zhuwentaonis]MBT1035891.1 CPBP family intramembrane metalloprotease [Canibacter zhuwentaonis]
MPHNHTSELQSAAPKKTYPWAHKAVPAESQHLPFHRLLRGINNYAWWKPLAIAGIGIGYYIAMVIVATIAYILAMQVAAAGGSASPAELQKIANDLGVIDTRHPARLAYQLGSIILMIPATWLALLTFRAHPTGIFFSVVGRIRWSLFGYSLGIAVITFVGAQVIATVVESIFGEASTDTLTKDTTPLDASTLVWSLIIIVLLVPLQATAEEYIFRGAMLQMLGAWIRNPIVPSLITTLLFVIGHGYELWGLILVGLLGLTVTFLTIRTGGIEAGIAIHMVNNLVVFGILASGVTGDTKQSESAGNIASAILNIIMYAVYIGAIELVWRKRKNTHGWQNYRETKAAAAPDGAFSAPHPASVSVGADVPPAVQTGISASVGTGYTAATPVAGSPAAADAAVPAAPPVPAAVSTTPQPPVSQQTPILPPAPLISAAHKPVTPTTAQQTLPQECTCGYATTFNTSPTALTSANTAPAPRAHPAYAPEPRPLESYTPAPSPPITREETPQLDGTSLIPPAPDIAPRRPRRAAPDPQPPRYASPSQ